MDQLHEPVPGIIRKPSPSGQLPPTVQSPPPPRKPYLKRVFQGRLNRQNYNIGSLLLMGPQLLCFLLILASFLTSSGTMEWLTINPYDIKQLQDSSLQADQIQQSLNDLQNSLLNKILLLFVTLYSLITLPATLGLQVRRLHDLNNSGWLFLLNLIPFVSYFFPFYIAFFPGTNGDNKYGPKPLPRINIRNDILTL